LNNKRSSRKIGWWIVILLVIAGGIAFYFFKPQPAQKADAFREVHPAIGDLQIAISTTGVVQPEKRIEINPPLSGRIEKILVQEGDHVRAGQVLAWLSSSERAALLDTAHSQGKEAVAYWENIYKPIPLVAPISGEVIVRAIEPGQSVDASTVVLVLSDHLIVKAQVDETDVGHVHLNQTAEISLDAYPTIKVRGRISHINYESTVQNNVAIYPVDVLPKTVPPEFRSGMSATVKIIQQEKKAVLTIPQEAILPKGERNRSQGGTRRGESAYSPGGVAGETDKTKPDETRGAVLIKSHDGTPSRQRITLGISDGQNTEVIEGLSETDTVLIATTPTNRAGGAAAAGSNPFMPMRGGGGRGGGR